MGVTPTFNIKTFLLISNVQLLDMFSMTHFVTKARPIIINLVSVELHIL